MTSSATNNDDKSKTQINHEIIQQISYYYSLCKKQQHILSMLHNQRIFVFNQYDQILYYINKPQPFSNLKSFISKPKNVTAHLLQSNFNYDNGVLTIRFIKKVDQNVTNQDVWKFTMSTPQLTQKWCNFLKSKKQEKEKQSQSQNQNYNQNENENENESQENQENNDEQNETPNQTDINTQNNIYISNRQQQNNNNQIPQNYPQNPQSKVQILASQQQQQIKPNNQQQNFQNLSNTNQSNQSNQSNFKPFVLSIKPTQNNKNNILNNYQPIQQHEDHQQQTNTNQNQHYQTQQQSNKQINQFKNQTRIKHQINTNTKNQNSSIYYKSKQNNLSNPQNIINDKNVDWNKKFLIQTTQKTISQFSNYIDRIFITLNPQYICFNNQVSNQFKQISTNGITFIFVQSYSDYAIKLKKQFKNYHYILQCCKQNICIHVPLCCIIQYLGMVCLAKAQFPQNIQKITNINHQSNSQINRQFKMLQFYTKISSQVIKKQAAILNLSQSYGMKDNMPSIYIDNLLQYLPNNPQSINLQNYPIRSELILDNYTKVINPKTQQSKQQFSSYLTKSIDDLCEVLSENQSLITSYYDLKQLLHEHGINTKLLPKIYSKVKSRLAKKFIHTAMLAHLIKQLIQKTTADYRESGRISQIAAIIEQILRTYCEVPSSKNDKAWKNIGQQFKKAYKILFNIHELQSGFFLSTLLQMIKVQWRIQKLNKNKRVLEDEEIFNIGFIVKLLPKIKKYQKFNSEHSRKIIGFCRDNTKNSFNQLKQIVNLDQPQSIHLSQPYQIQFHTYLSNYIHILKQQHPLMHQTLSSHINTQPPTLSSHLITINYIQQYQKYKKLQQYKKIISNSLDIITYWLGDDHPLLCDIFQSLSNYSAKKGDIDGSINFMKQALTTCIRSIGTHTNRAGIQYFKLAQKQMIYGQKDDAIQNYQKAKLNIQGLGKINPQYPILLMKISSIQLSKGNINKCIQLAMKAIKNSQNNHINDSTLIKIYQLLSRAYQVNSSKQQIKNLAHLTAKVFNNTQNCYTFDQMIRICAIGFITTLVPSKQQKFQQYISYLKKTMNVILPQKQSIKKLMILAEDTIIMQKFYDQLLNIEKHVNQIKIMKSVSSQTKQIKNFFQTILTIVGFDFMEGILYQAKFF